MIETKTEYDKFVINNVIYHILFAQKYRSDF